MMDENINNMNVNVIVISNINIKKILNFLNKCQILFNDEYSAIFINFDVATKLKLNNGTIIKLFLQDKMIYKYSVVVIYDIDDDDIFLPKSSNISDEIIFYTLPNLIFNLGECFRSNKFNCTFKTIKNINVNDSLKISNINISEVKFANKIMISCIFNPNYDCSVNYDYMLKTYFDKPRLLMENGVFYVYSKDDPFYWNNISHFSCPMYPLIYFKVNRIEPDLANCPYLIHNDYTSLIQESSVSSFIPCCVSQMFDDSSFDYLEYLQCFDDIGKNMLHYIFPFLYSKNDIKLLMKKLIPVFLLSGPVPSGKSLLCQSIAMSLNIPHITLNCDLLIGDTVTATETNLDRTFKNVCASAPCMLILENFEMMGKNKDGEIDSHIRFSFKEFIYRLIYNCENKIIIMATSITLHDVSIHDIFLQLWHIQAPLEEERCKMLKCILKSYNFDSTVILTDLAKNLSGMYYDNLQRLVEIASEISFQRNYQDSGAFTDIYPISQIDFEEATKKIQKEERVILGTPQIPNVKWEDIGGLEEAKREIIDTVLFPTKYSKLVEKGLYRSGILLYGPPGVGKTLLAKAVATEFLFNFISIKGAELLNMYVGQSEENVREVFKKARLSSPCIIFFDELDALAPNRGKNGDSAGVMDRVVSQLLSEMDGMDKNSQIFFIGATNRPDLIDPAMLRPGRFDKMIYLGINEDKDSQLKILKALTSKFILGDGFNLEDIVCLCPCNMTGADFYSLAADAFFRRIKKLISKYPIECESGNIEIIVEKEDFEEALKDIKMSVTTEELTKYQNLKDKYSK